MIGNRAKRGFLNEAADDIQAITGVARGTARNLARGNQDALDKITTGKRRRVERVGAERASRLHQLELTRRKLRKSIQAFERARKAESVTGQVRAMLGGGVIQPQSAISS